jgi:hypothetical protein
LILGEAKNLNNRQFEKQKFNFDLQPPALRENIHPFITRIFFFFFMGAIFAFLNPDLGVGNELILEGPLN